MKKLAFLSSHLPNRISPNFIEYHLLKSKIGTILGTIQRSDYNLKVLDKERVRINQFFHYTQMGVQY